MRFNRLTRRSLLFGVGGFAAGGAVTGVVGFKYRDQVRKLLGVSRPNITQLGMASGAEDDWLLSAADREELTKHIATAQVE